MDIGQYVADIVSRHAGWLMVTVGCWGSGLLLALPVAGSDFRVETKIYEGEKEDDPEETEPVNEAVTLFANGVVYDFLTAPARIAVFRGATGDKPGRFILLDPTREVRTELTTDRIAGLLGKIRVWAAQQEDPVLRFAAQPTFEESFEPGSGELLLESPLQTYRLQTAATSRTAAVAQYCEALDWYAQLGAVMHGGPPPQPRLAVNAALARHGVVPVEVQLTSAGQREPLRAEHDFTWRLSRDDMSRIDEVQEAMTRYREVDNETFRSAPESEQP